MGLFSHVLLVFALSVMGFYFLGRALDSITGKGFFFILGILAGILLGMWGAFRLIMKYLNK